MDAELERIILTDPLKTNFYGRITSFDVYDNHIYALYKSTIAQGGAVITFNMETSETLIIDASDLHDSSAGMSFEPKDIVVTNNRILVSDAEYFNVYEYTHEGESLGAFGQESFRKLIKNTKLRKDLFAWSRYLAIVIMLALLIRVLVANKKIEKKKNDHYLTREYEFYLDKNDPECIVFFKQLALRKRQAAMREKART